jgi:hypothetical protein
MFLETLVISVTTRCVKNGAAPQKGREWLANLYLVVEFHPRLYFPHIDSNRRMHQAPYDPKQELELVPIGGLGFWRSVGHGKLGLAVGLPSCPR